MIFVFFPPVPRRPGDKSKKKVVMVEPDQTSKKVTGLNPDKEYVVNVTPETGGGRGPSTKIWESTLPAAGEI